MKGKQALLTVAAVLVGILPASAQMERLRAYSTTAVNITGDVSTDDFEIVFENGETPVFSDLLADNFIVYGKRVPASVYRIETPADPELLNGNRLCGAVT